MNLIILQLHENLSIKSAIIIWQWWTFFVLNSH